jgi:hypothetical protein
MGAHETGTVFFQSSANQRFGVRAHLRFKERGSIVTRLSKLQALL